MNFTIENGAFLFNNQVLRQFVLGEYEGDVASLTYRYNKDRTPSAEIDGGFPFMLTPFIIQLIATRGKLPEDYEFTTFYINRDFVRRGDILHYRNREFSLKGMVGRAMRTHPSFIREFHFPLLCYFSSLFDRVQYNYEDDRNGNDLNIWYRGKRYAVSLYTDTGKAKKKREDKLNNRHNEYYTGLKRQGVTLIDLALPLQHIPNTIELYTIDDVYKLRDALV